MDRNELKNAVSPYLLQHASNPVHWRLWGAPALDEAKTLNRPVLLSIGYAACHWCHVMAHESFEDEATAAILNSFYVPIKVDREERPDLDHLYMSAVQAFGERGGWPLTVFLTPSGEPFWGGTYYPKRASHGRPGFADVLHRLAATYHRDPARVANNCKAVMSRLGHTAETAGPALTGPDFDATAKRITPLMDATHGGFGQAPKFLNPPILEMLWRAAARGGEAMPRDLVLLTLERMCQGGIYDHLGGGFARYSTDDRWLVPHFEKMLYDNAQLIELLALAAAKTGNPLFATRAAETVEWIAREMTSAEGAFFSSLDADSDGVEGKFYVWTAVEIEAVLGPADAALFAQAYDVTTAGNWHEPGAGICVLNRLHRPNFDTEAETRLGTCRDKLVTARAARTRPATDDKILTDWNGLTIAALVRAGTLLDRPEWFARAAKAYRAVLAMMRYDDAQGRLRLAHGARGTVPVRPGLALDYAAMMRAALALQEVSGFLDEAPHSYLRDARAFGKSLLACHRDGASGRLCMAASDADDVILRLKPTADDAIPNAHAVAIEAFLRFAALASDPAARETADQLLAAVADEVRANPAAHAGIFNALDLSLRGLTVVTAGPLRELFTLTALGAPYLNRNVIDLWNSDDLSPDHPARAQLRAAGDGAAFVCAHETCSPPVHDAIALASLLTG